MLEELDLPSNPALIVGPRTLDDAGVYKISDDQCLVQTVDYFPPPARDPHSYGQIAAANSLSDVYAMGGKPITALAVVCVPAVSPGPEILKETTRGASDKLREAGVVLVGGHSVVDPQIKFGLAVTGIVHPDKIMDNAHARTGDVLILTKPLGTGVLIMATRGGLASQKQEEEANRCMSTLNAEASRIALEYGVVSCTDVTGFGLLGHAYQMARASGVSMEININDMPKLEGALEYAAMGLLSAATYTNREYVGAAAEFDGDIQLPEQDLLFDPQTSGGLLIACPEDRAERMMARMKKVLSTPCGVVGSVAEPTGTPTIRVKRSAGRRHEG